MQRAAVRAVLTARRAPLLFPRISPRNVFGARNTASSTTGNHGGVVAVSSSASYIRNFTIALVSSLVFSGAWFAYKETNELLLTPLSFVQSPGSDRNGYGTSNGEARQRRVVAVGDEGLFTGIVQGEGPLSKDTLGEQGGRKVLEMLSPEEATNKLRRSQESYLVGRDRGVFRYDIVQVPSNDPIEDDHAERIIVYNGTTDTPSESSPSTDWMFWGVFDGHSGWTTSAKLRQVLIGFVARELNETYKASSNANLQVPTPQSIDTAIKRGFLRLDHEIIHESVDKVMKNPSKVAAAEILAPALSGSCALLAFYDSSTKLLRVACTGDSRAVLGRRSKNGNWTATPLSVDQTGSNEAEAQRMRNEHPGEDSVIKSGRVLGGLEPTRAFGDSFYKWSMETQLMIKNKFFGRTPHRLLKTPPYVTAEPVVSTTSINPDSGDFVVLATDGLWEMLTNEEVVGLVGQWIENQKTVGAEGTKAKSWFGSLFGGGESKDNVLPIDNSKSSNEKGQRQPIRQEQWGITAPQNQRFVVEDNNCATHLVRNALGGKDKDMLCALLTLPSPYSRRYRDDLTVEVIFFGEGDKSGNVVVNDAATAMTTVQT